MRDPGSLEAYSSGNRGLLCFMTRCFFRREKPVRPEIVEAALFRLQLPVIRS